MHYGTLPLVAAAAAPISDAEYRVRQATFTDQLPLDTVALIPSNPVATRSADVHYPYRTNSDLLYLTGWSAPNSVAVFHHQQEGGWRCRLFVEARDITQETWTGRRPGLEGALEGWPCDESANIENLADELTVLLCASTSVHHIPNLSADLDAIVESELSVQSRERQRSGSGPTASVDPRPLLAEMRLIKSAAEVELMRHAARISSAAHEQTMRMAQPGWGEAAVQGLIEACFTTNQSEWAYPTIAAGGDNATILHYISNRDQIGNGQLILIDAGAEYLGYAADITRTWPISGSFSAEQKVIYELVLKSQLAAIAACRSGNPYTAPHDAAREVLAKGLMELGIIGDQELEQALDKEQLGRFYMHNTGHWLGMDVHDVGIYMPEGEARELRPGMVITVEPGLYFGAWRDDLGNVEPKWLGIGIRIEDDVLITEGDPDVLTADCPKSIEELESIIGCAD